MFLDFRKRSIDSAVKKLLRLKAEYKNLSGKDYKPPTTSTNKQQEPEEKATVSSTEIYCLRLFLPGNSPCEFKIVLF